MCFWTSSVCARRSYFRCTSNGYAARMPAHQTDTPPECPHIKRIHCQNARTSNGYVARMSAHQTDTSSECRHIKRLHRQNVRTSNGYTARTSNGYTARMSAQFQPWMRPKVHACVLATVTFVLFFLFFHPQTIRDGDLIFLCRVK